MIKRQMLFFVLLFCFASKFSYASDRLPDHFFDFNDSNNCAHLVASFMFGAIEKIGGKTPRGRQLARDALRRYRTREMFFGRIFPSEPENLVKRAVDAKSSMGRFYIAPEAGDSFIFYRQTFLPEVKDSILYPILHAKFVQHRLDLKIGGNLKFYVPGDLEFDILHHAGLAERMGYHRKVRRQLAQTLDQRVFMPPEMRGKNLRDLSILLQNISDEELRSFYREKYPKFVSIVLKARKVARRRCRRIREMSYLLSEARAFNRVYSVLQMYTEEELEQLRRANGAMANLVTLFKEAKEYPIVRRRGYFLEKIITMLVDAKWKKLTVPDQFREVLDRTIILGSDGAARRNGDPLTGIDISKEVLGWKAFYLRMRLPGRIDSIIQQAIEQTR